MNNCAKLFWKWWPWQSQFMTILSFDLQVWHWPSTYLNRYFIWQFYSSRRQLCQIILKSIRKYRSYGPDKLNLWPLQVWPWPSIYLNRCFKWDFSSSRTTTVPIILESMHKCKIMAWTNPDGGTHALMHAYTPNQNCNSYVSLHRKQARQKE